MARFDNENYRNWLKTTESLNTLKIGLRSFLENETETHHSSLQQELGHILKEATCQNKCDGKQWGKKIPDCKICIPWKEAILACYAGSKASVHWRNCKPYLWPKEKWEVAKVYMPQGHQEHTIYDHFDIAALLNLMGHCKHFRKFIKDQPINKVINVRNCVMHSPDFTVSRQDFEQHLDKIKTFASLMDQHAQDLKTLPNEIEKICVIVDNAAGKQEDFPDAPQQKYMEMEQKALKEKIEFLAQQYEEDQDGVKEEIEGIKTFLLKNEDLKEKLAPQMEQLQKRVDEHERKINVLNERVDQLEVKVTQGPKKDPLFSMNPMKYKNYIFELARKYGWPEPVFTESLEDDGYRGHLEVKGLRFAGEQACLSKKLAHQEVAKKALDHLQVLATSAGEGGQMKHLAEPSENSMSEASGSRYYGSVTVALDTAVVNQEGHSKKGEAIEYAYRKLAENFGLDNTEPGSSRAVVQMYFKRSGYPLPVENVQECPNDKISCSLKLTFLDQEGSTKKKQAEQQAAKTALQQLSRVLNWKPSGENYIGDLKERLEALGLGKPSYNVTKSEKVPGDEHGSSDSRSPQAIVSEFTAVNMEVCSNQTDGQLEDSDRPPCRISGDDTQPTPFKKESTSTSVEALGSQYYGCVTIALDTILEDKEGHLQEGDAIESAYRKLAESFGLDSSEPGFSRAVVQKYFERSGYPLPVENIQEFLDDKISCSLKLCGSFTFVDHEGSTKKRQAEQQAAKTALQQLSKVLNWKPNGENYKGDLKEKLEALGLGQPSYDITKKEGSADERGHSVALYSCEPAGSSNMNPTPGGTSALNSKEHPSEAELRPLPTKPDTAVVAPVIPTIEPSSPPAHRKQAKIQFQDGKVEKLLKVLGLLPPVVTCEKCSMEQWFTCRVSVKLDGYTFASPSYFRNKKEACRKAFHLFALATGICSPGADEMLSTKEVKQFFAQKLLPFPEEKFGEKENTFSCSLTNVSCDLVYEGQGSSEGEARQAAFQDAFSKLGRLSGISEFFGTLDKADERLSDLLKMAGQGEPVSSLKAQQYKASVQLKFTDYKLEHKSNTNKKQARNYLSERILKILGVDTDASTSGSLRNSLDEWFKRKKLPAPNFEEMKEPPGVRVTFSAPFSCSSPDWEDSWAQAEESLLQELTARLSWNKEGGTAAESSSPGL